VVAARAPTVVLTLERLLFHPNLGCYFSLFFSFSPSFFFFVPHRWLQLEHPTVVLTLERLLFACCPITGAAVQTWGLVSSVGILYAPFYLLPTLFLLYWLFSIPQQSSLPPPPPPPLLP